MFNMPEVETCHMCGTIRVEESLAFVQGEVSKETKRKLQSHVIDGKAAMENRSWNAALREFNDALSIDPKNIHVLHDRSFVNAKLQRYGVAFEDAERAVALHPENIMGYIRLGQAQLHLHLGMKALESYQKAHELEPNNFEVTKSIRALKRLRRASATKYSMEGYLYKKYTGNLWRRTWQKRYVVLSREVLSYYRSKEDPKPAGIIPLYTIQKVTQLQDEDSRLFEFMVKGARRTHMFHFRASSREIAAKWVIELKDLSSRHAIAHKRAKQEGKKGFNLRDGDFWKDIDDIQLQNMRMQDETQNMTAMEDRDNQHLLAGTLKVRPGRWKLAIWRNVEIHADLLLWRNRKNRSLVGVLRFVNLESIYLVSSVTIKLQEVSGSVTYLTCPNVQTAAEWVMELLQLIDNDEVRRVKKAVEDELEFEDRQKKNMEMRQNKKATALVFQGGQDDTDMDEYATEYFDDEKHVASPDGNRNRSTVNEEEKYNKRLEALIQQLMAATSDVTGLTDDPQLIHPQFPDAFGLAMSPKAKSGSGSGSGVGEAWRKTAFTEEDVGGQVLQHLENRVKMMVSEEPSAALNPFGASSPGGDGYGFMSAATQELEPELTPQEEAAQRKAERKRLKKEKKRKRKMGIFEEETDGADFCAANKGRAHEVDDDGFCVVCGRNVLNAFHSSLAAASEDEFEFGFAEFQGDHVRNPSMVGQIGQVALV